MRRTPRIIGILLLALALAHCSKNNHVAYGLTSVGTIIQFETSDPTNVKSQVTVVNATSASTGSSALAQIAYRPANNGLYGITGDNYVVTIAPDTGDVTRVGTTAFTADVLSDALISFDAVTDELRVVDTNHNLRVSPTDGTLIATGTKVAFASGDVNNGATPALVGLAYDNQSSTATATTLFALDSGSHDLVRIGNINASDPTVADGGQMTSIGSTNLSFGSVAGFDIEQSDGVAYATLSPTSSPSILYTIDLGSGIATEVGVIGASNYNVSSLAVVPGS